MATLRHHTGAEAPPHRPSFLEATQLPKPGEEEKRARKYQDVARECEDVADDLRRKQEELESLVRERMGVPYPYSLIIFGPRGVGKTALFIQLEKQLQSRAHELEATVRTLQQQTPRTPVLKAVLQKAKRTDHEARLDAPGGSPAARPQSSPSPGVAPVPVPSPGAQPTPLHTAQAAPDLKAPLERAPLSALEREVLQMAGANDVRESAKPETPAQLPIDAGGSAPTVKLPAKGMTAAALLKRAETAYAHKEWRRSRVNLQSIQFYLAAVEGASMRPWVVDLFLWDVNDPRAAAMFYYGAKCVCLMYDCNDRRSFAAVRQLYAEARRMCARASFVLIGNKADLRKKSAAMAGGRSPSKRSSGTSGSSGPPTAEEVAAFCKEEGLEYFDCSALDPSSVEHVTAHVQAQVENSTRDHWAEEGAVPGSAEKRVEDRVDRGYELQERLTGVLRRNQRRPSLTRLAALRRSESLARMRARFAEEKALTPRERALQPATPIGEPTEPVASESSEDEPSDVADFGIGLGPNVLWPETGCPLQGHGARQVRRAQGLRAAFDELNSDGLGITAQQFLMAYEYAGETEEEVRDIVHQFAPTFDDRLGYAEFGLLMLRLRPKHNSPFLFPTRGDSAFASRKVSEGLLPHFQRLHDTFGDNQLYPRHGARNEILSPQRERDMLRMFNALGPSPERLVSRDRVRKFLRKASNDSDKEIEKILDSYAGDQSANGALSYSEFAMLVARVPNPLADTTPTPFTFRCRGSAKYPVDQSRVPITTAQLRRHWKALLAQSGCSAGAETVPVSDLCDWVLGRDSMGCPVTRPQIEELVDNIWPGITNIDFDIFCAVALKTVSAA